MKTGIFALFFSLGLFTLTSCEHNADLDLGAEVFESDAIITSYETRRLGCRGGWILDIEGQDFEKYIYALPEGTDIGTVDVEYPIAVELTWSVWDEICPNAITLESIALK